MFLCIVFCVALFVLLCVVVQYFLRIIIISVVPTCNKQRVLSIVQSLHRCVFQLMVLWVVRLLVF